MAYSFESFYYFRPYRGNSSFWLNRNGSGTISNHQIANLYSPTGDPDQRLQIHQVTGGCQLLSALNTAYGLNIYGSTAGSPCDFYPVANNFNDALIDLLTVDASQNLYRIKLINHNLYLTPASNASGAALTWENASGADNQVWQLCTTQGTASSTNYLIYPSTHMRITQNYNGTYSHTPNSTGSPADYPIDEGCANTGRSYLYCPCDQMVVKRVYGVGGSGTNTIWLESTSPVVMPCGTDYVTMMVIHPNDDTLSGISVGDTFTRKSPMFLEGNDGASAYHFHISIGTGRFTGTGWVQNSNGNYVLKTTGNNIKPEQGFYVDTSFTTVLNNGGLTFQNKP